MSAADKKQIVFLHGGPGFSDYLAEFFSEGFSDGVETIFYNQRSKQPSLDGFLDQLEGILKPLGPNIFLVGHSWGATLLLEYLNRRHDRRVTKAILMDPCVCSEHFKEAFQTRLAELKIENPTWAQIFLSSDEQAIGEGFIKKLETKFDSVVFEAFSKYLDTFDLRSVIASLKIPLQNIFGSEDIRVPAQVLRTLPTLNPQLSNLEIQGAGHFPFLLPRNRTKIVAAIQTFLK